MNVNLYFFELSRIMKNDAFVDSTALSNKCFNNDGINLNWIGKKLITTRVCKEIKAYYISKQTGFETCNNYRTSPKETNTNKELTIDKQLLNITEENKKDVTIEH